MIELKAEDGTVLYIVVSLIATIKGLASGVERVHIDKGAKSVITTVQGMEIYVRNTPQNVIDCILGKMTADPE